MTDDLDPAAAPPLASTHHGRRGRLKVQERLTTPRHPNEVRDEELVPSDEGARVLLTTTARDDKRARYDFQQLRRSAGEGASPHALTSDPTAADIILFVERESSAKGRLGAVRGHPLFREFRDKVFVFDARYKGIPFVPGVYSSIMNAHHDPRRTRSGHYLEVQEDAIMTWDPEYEPRYLFSFVGTSWTHHVRRDILQLHRPDALLVDTAPQGILIKKVQPVRDEVEVEYFKSYVRRLKDSRFILCPRGTGPSSLRLFESMMVGRVPVIISDEWVPPNGPEWSQFSLRVKERDVGSIPALCEENADAAEEMGRAAREAWETWFSIDRSFHSIVEWCLDIKRSRRHPAWRLEVAAYACYLKPQTYGDDVKALRHRASGALRSLKSGRTFNHV